MSTLSRRTLTLVYETNGEIDPEIFALSLAEYARYAIEAECTFDITDMTMVEFGTSQLTHLIVRELEDEDEKDVIAWKFQPKLLEEDIEEPFPNLG